MIYIKLFLVFMKIGLFSFGGGYAMIPMIQKETESNGWMSPSDFVDIISISEITPGPISVNSATYIGYKVAGIPGSFSSTVGVSLPSLILIMIVSRFFFKYYEKPVNTMIFYGIRPVIAGLIWSAGISVAKTSIFKSDLVTEVFNYSFSIATSVIDFRSVGILVVVLLILVKYKVHPVLTILGAGMAGIIVYIFIPSL
ncbi:chromate transportert ChrA [Thermoclostridium stercorarium subsp. stercorarium DSM 8532]|uniref:Chromate transportert ChrA n=4 Tax=Thermoclostridium stercorarium TaxID=1510 RepID=L7VLY7_THES1|nr:chromate transporter [Thermoclostridium stercorarium]AGC67747.1 chromate transportert ChrA [Thermoclostridium stercorarium subsp. stercorarium DSM 8532]ANW98159.1 chromate transporter [Thermoclostridium stercorarium subsp. thermolacticum DSM 2910]ANX00701.1 chromate transporter [Thermoclostridium stercorarium subsp. leptospartum DSM 9219]